MVRVSGDSDHTLDFELDFQGRVQQTSQKVLLGINRPPTPDPSDVDDSDSAAMLAAMGSEMAPPIPPKSFIRRPDALCKFTDTPPESEPQSPSIDDIISDNTPSSPVSQIEQNSAPHSPDQVDIVPSDLYRNRSKSLLHVACGLIAQDDEQEKARKLKWAPFIIPELFRESTVPPVPALPVRKRPSISKHLFTPKPDRQTSTAASTQEPETSEEVFMEELFRDAIIMFDGDATLYQATIDNNSTNDWRHQHSTTSLSTSSRVCVIRRKELEPTGAAVYTTSIWIISSDFRIRIQQRLPTSIEITPFASFFDPERVSLTMSCQLLQYGPVWGSGVTKTLTAHWTSFTFSSVFIATDFQPALFGRPLIDSFQIEKTTLLRPSLLRSKLAYEEQVAGMERLRLWHENGDVGPGATGGVMAMMHMSPNFGEGYIRWWVNSARVARYKKRGSRSVDVHGLDVAVARAGLGKVVDSSVGGGRGQNSPNTPDGARAGVSEAAPFEMQRRDSVATVGSQESGKREGKNKRIKMVSGLRITFVNELERGRFLVQVEEARRRMLPLPDF